MPLTMVGVGKSMYIKKIGGRDDTRRHLENLGFVVGVFGVLDFEGLGALAGYSFLAFNLLCSPCFAAIGAIKREMSNAKWTWLAIGFSVLWLMRFHFA